MIRFILDSLFLLVVIDHAHCSVLSNLALFLKPDLLIALVRPQRSACARQADLALLAKSLDCCCPVSKFHLVQRERQRRAQYWECFSMQALAL